MTVQKNALLMFTKPPEPGMVKTRLTTQHEGILTEEQAAALYRCMMLDVLECAMQGLEELEENNRIEREADPSAPEQVYEVFVSTTPEDSVAKMEKVLAEAGPWSHPVNVILDKGKVFDDHFDNAFNYLFDQGFGTCVALGGDLPSMPRSHIVDSFEWLHYFQGICPEGGMVIAPCQAAGTSLVGYTPECGMNHQEVYYNLTGRPALQGYLDKMDELGGVHMALLSAVPDVDNVEDLAHVITYANALEAASEHQNLFVPSRTLAFVRMLGLKVSTPPNRNFDNRDNIDV